MVFVGCGRPPTEPVDAKTSGEARSATGVDMPVEDPSGGDMPIEGPSGAEMDQNPK